MKRLDEILKRCETATPGPWHEGCATVMSDKGSIIADFCGHNQEIIKAGEDSIFTSHARTDLPLVVEALQKALTALNAYATVEELMHRGKYALTCIAEIEALLGNGK